MTLFTMMYRVGEKGYSGSSMMGGAAAPLAVLHLLMGLVTWVAVILVLLALAKYLSKKADKLK